MESWISRIRIVSRREAFLRLSGISSSDAWAILPRTDEDCIEHQTYSPTWSLSFLHLIKESFDESSFFDLRILLFPSMINICLWNLDLVK